MTYSLEFLIQRFQEHAKKTQENQDSLVRDFKECNPDVPITDFISDPFNLPLALASICKEIQEIKCRLEASDYEGYIFDEGKRMAYITAVDKFLSSP